MHLGHDQEERLAYPTHRRHNMKFLIVDDSLTMCAIIRGCISRISTRENVYVFAGNGQKALEKFDRTIEFVIVDDNMPVMSGIEFIRELRTRPEGMSVPVLLASTSRARKDIIAGTKAGANGFIVKPPTPLFLKEKVDALLSAQQPY